jgi:hypothetical protein
MAIYGKLEEIHKIKGKNIPYIGTMNDWACMFADWVLRLHVL